MWRVAIVGIDGSGKTTTALRLVERLVEADRLVVCQPGRPSVVLCGAVAAGAWGVSPDGEARALVAYAEPSRTEVWGLWVGEDARLQGAPFRVAATEEGELLCREEGQGRIAVAFDAGEGAWTVDYAAYSGERTRHRAVTVKADGEVEAPRPVDPPTDEEGPVLRWTRVGGVDLSVLGGSPPRLRLEGVG